MKKISWVWSLLKTGVLSIAFVLMGCEEELHEYEERLKPVKYVVVSAEADSSRDRVFSGTTHAAQEARLSFNVGGTVEEISVGVGERLKPGDIVANLDSTTYQVEVERARASLAASESERRSAESEYQRVRQLYANNNSSQTELETALSRTQSATANSEASQQSLRLARLNLQYTNLVVDDDCIVGTISVEENENVSAGTTVATVNCGDRWEAHIVVPENLIASFRRGMTGVVELDAVPGKRFSGQVSEVGVIGAGSAFQVTVLLDEGHESIRSGLAVEVTLTLMGNSNQGSLYVVPPTSVGQDELGTHVYLLNDTEDPAVATLHRTKVVVGKLVESGLQVLDGLNEGDRVLTAGVTAAREGLRVTTTRAAQ